MHLDEEAGGLGVFYPPTGVQLPKSEMDSFDSLVHIPALGSQYPPYQVHTLQAGNLLNLSGCLVSGGGGGRWVFSVPPPPPPRVRPSVAVCVTHHRCSENQLWRGEGCVKPMEGWSRDLKFEDLSMYPGGGG